MNVHIVLTLTQNIELPVKCVQGGYLVYRSENETLHALDASLTATGRCVLSAADVPAVLGPLYRTGAVVAYSPADHGRLVSAVGTVRPPLTRKRSCGGLALVR